MKLNLTMKLVRKTAITEKAVKSANSFQNLTSEGRRWKADWPKIWRYLKSTRLLLLRVFQANKMRNHEFKSILSFITKKITPQTLIRTNKKQEQPIRT